MDETNEPVAEISVQETNRLRESLGLKPLQIDAAAGAAETPEQNYANARAAQAETARQKLLAENLEKARNKRKLNALRAGSTLGDDDDQLSTQDWIKKVGSKRKIPQDAKNETKTQGNATAAGLRVAHDASALLQHQGDQGEILVLQDVNVLDDDAQDTLQSVALAASTAKEKSKKRSKAGRYDAYDEDGNRKGLLHQYDEEETDDFFTIGKHGKVDVKTAEKKALVSEKLGESLAQSRTQISDYYTKEEDPVVVFKKPKKKKKKRNTRARQQSDDDADQGAPPTTDNAPPSPPIREKNFGLSNASRNIDDVNFVDDDDLQDMLSRARKVAQKGAKKQKEEEEDELPAVLLQTEQQDTRMDSDPEDGRLVISSTSEFVRTLGEDQESEAEAEHAPTAPVQDHEMEQAPPADASRPSPTIQTITAQTTTDVDMDDAPMQIDAPAEEPAASEDGEIPVSEQIDPLVLDEPLVSTGLAATLSVLRSKGVLKEADVSRDAEASAATRRHAAWIAGQRRAEAQARLEAARSRERNRALGEEGKRRLRLDERDRAANSAAMQRERVRAAVDRFKDYTPAVDISYHDETGRKLGPKEAFRQLSHKFHGLKGGKKTIEKRMRKQEEDIKVLQSNSQDTPLGVMDALSRYTRDSGSAHMVLSVGNRATVASDGAALFRGEAGQSAIPLTKPGAQESERVVNVPAATQILNPEDRKKVAFGFGRK